MFLCAVFFVCLNPVKALPSLENFICEFCFVCILCLKPFCLALVPVYLIIFHLLKTLFLNSKTVSEPQPLPILSQLVSEWDKRHLEAQSSIFFLV